MERKGTKFILKAILLLERGPGPEQVCLGLVDSVRVLDLVQERFHNTRPG